MQSLQVLFPKMVHVTYKANAMHRVAELAQSNFLLVDKLIETGYNIFDNAPHRIQIFKQQAPGISLPPSPVYIRWGMWIDAAVYYCSNYRKILDIVMSLDKTEAQCIEECQDILQNVEIS